jgi:hypothetical protein
MKMALEIPDLLVQAGVARALRITRDKRRRKTATPRRGTRRKEKMRSGNERRRRAPRKGKRGHPD